MKTKTVTASLTALAALALGFGAYFTMPDGRVLAKKKSIAMSGCVIPTPRRTDCAICIPDGSACSPAVMPPKGASSPYHTCTGTYGFGIMRVSYYDAVAVTVGCKDIELIKFGSDSWRINESYKGKTGNCGSRIAICNFSESTCELNNGNE